MSSLPYLASRGIKCDILRVKRLDKTDKIKQVRNHVPCIKITSQYFIEQNLFYRL
nr:MAG TPA: hypothetical protein [Caudoviricetes sp.]